MHRLSTLAVLAASGLAAQAQNVQVLSSGDELVDQAAIALLENAGFQASLGPEYWQLDASSDFSAFDAVLALGGPNWADGWSFTEEAQQVLADYAASGGGIVFSEWFGYNAAVRGWVALGGLLPTTYGGYISGETVDYTEAAPTSGTAATVTCMVPSLVAAAADNFAGTESMLVAKPDATVFFESATSGGAGLTGWDVGAGRVMHFSSSIGVNQLADPDFSRLILNSLAWADEGPACEADLVRAGILDLSDINVFVNSFLGGCD